MKLDNMKGHHTEWDKIVANNMTNKGLISNMYKQLIQLNIKKQTTGLKNEQKNLIDTFQREHTYGQQECKKMFNITNHQGNANQSHNEISTHTCQNDYRQKEYKQ